MDLNSLSEEVLDLIIRELEPLADEWNPDDLRPPTDFCNARLVCRRWNNLATTHLFRSVTLVPTEEVDFEKWNETLNSDVVSSVARRVVIRSSPEELTDRDYRTWDQWENEGEWPAYTDAISRISDIPHLRELCLRFTEHCRGAQFDSIWDDDQENISSRLHTLKAVFHAIQQRASIPGLHKITSLEIDNLQNIPLPEFTSSELFKAVTKDISQLHLRIAEECNEAGPDHDIHCVERVEFEPYLHKSWLAPMTDNLTALTLHFRECWGVMPGFFKGTGLVFPHLKTLNLGYFTIAHHDQVDWILAQTSLRSLQLDRCFIASHLRIRSENKDDWSVQTYDWEELPHGAYGFRSEGDLIYYFPGTWETVFDRIRNSLPHLVDFQFYIEEWTTYFDRPARGSTELSLRRYIVLDIGLLPSPWIEARDYDGEMDFGYNYPSVVNPSTGGEGRPGRIQNSPMNRAKDTEKGDGRALDALLKATFERRRLE